jgi:hypothetical protein
MPHLETWKWAWREAVAPQLSLAELEALRAGLLRNDPALIQGRTVQPDPLQKNLLEEPTACCPIAYALWKSTDNAPGAVTVDDVEHAFARICAGVDDCLQERRAARYFLNHVDEVPREQMLRELLVEVNIALTARSMELPAA